MQKRYTAGLLLYRFNTTDSEWEGFLQFRSPGMWYKPNEFSFFGGARDGRESPEEAVVREIHEELGMTISPDDISYVATHDGEVIHMDIYAMPVAEGFEETVTVMEGEYGKFLTESEIRRAEDFTNPEKTIVLDFFKTLEWPGV